MKVAFSKRLQLLSLSAILFLGIAFVLASPLRLTQRVSALYRQILPLGSNRPFTNITMAVSEFKIPPQKPPLFTGTPKSVKEDMDRLIQQSKALMDKLAADIRKEDARFSNVLLPMAYDDNAMGLEANILGFYQSVSTSQELRDASTEAEVVLEKFAIDSATRQDIFDIVDAAYRRGEKLDSESQRLLEKVHKDYIRAGMSLPAGEKRDKYKKIQEELSKLKSAFSQNLNEEKGGIWWRPDEVDGVREDLVASWDKGTGENEGKVRMTFKYPDFFPVMQFAKNAETRKKTLIASQNKLPQNIPIFRDVILKRDEAARLLGYENHAAYVIEDKMAKTPRWVDDFLGGLKGKLLEGGQKEKKVLMALKEKDLQARGQQDAFDGRYYLWDNRFYDRLMVEQDYSVDQEKVAEYFPLNKAIEGMFNIFQTLFGLEFVKVEGKDRDSISPSSRGDDIVWHPDCQIFSVWDSKDMGGGFVGYLYLDLHPREGKYGHAANFNIQPGFIDKNGTRHYPVTALVCNFSKPTPKKPSLLKHEEVTTLFHELGHGIHDLVSKTQYSRFHGTNVVRDFVEAPSQMLENWCWTPSQLKALSYHYSNLSPEYEAAWREQAGKDAALPKKELPDDLIANLVKTKHVNGALFNLRQLHFGIFDMAMHEPKSYAEAEAFKISEMYNDIGYELTKLDTPAQLGGPADWGMIPCASFTSHIYSSPTPLNPFRVVSRSSQNSWPHIRGCAC